MGFYALMTALKTGDTIRLPHGELRSVEGRIVSIEREDSSGKCWNVLVRQPIGGIVEVFVRTID